jgi:hypothetical protein
MGMLAPQERKVYKPAIFLESQGPMSIPKIQLDPHEQARARLLEARRLAANALRFLDDAEGHFANRNLVEGFLFQASDNAHKTVDAIEGVRRMLRQ